MQTATPYESTVEGDGVEKDTDAKKEARKLIKEVAVAVDTPLLQPKCAFLMVFALLIDSWTRWMRGCLCHEDLWTDKNMSYEAKMKAFRASRDHRCDHPSCLWKGKRLTELILGLAGMMVS